MSNMGRMGWLVAALDFVAVLALVVWGVSRGNVAEDLRAQLDQAQATAQAQIKELTDDLANANGERDALKTELAAMKQKTDDAVQSAAAPVKQDMAAAFEKLLSAKGARESDAGGSPMASIAKMFEGEGGEAAMDMTVQMQLNMEYDDYFSQARLSPEKEQRAKEILGEYKKERMRLELDRMQGKLDQRTSNTKRHELTEAQRADMSSMLSSSEMAAWEQYETDKHANMLSRGIDSQLAMYAPGLTPENREMAKQVITEEFLASGGNSSDPMGQDLQRARERLSASFGPDQMIQLDRYIQHSENAMKMQQMMMQPTKK